MSCCILFFFFLLLSWEQQKEKTSQRINKGDAKFVQKIPAISVENVANQGKEGLRDCFARFHSERLYDLPSSISHQSCNSPE